MRVPTNSSRGVLSLLEHSYFVRNGADPELVHAQTEVEDLGEAYRCEKLCIFSIKKKNCMSNAPLRMGFRVACNVPDSTKTQQAQ